MGDRSINGYPEIELDDIDPSDIHFQDIDLAELDYTLDYIVYPDPEDIKTIHSDIIQEDEDASKGLFNYGDVDFTLNYIEHGHFGEVPETIHEKAYHLMKLLAANHSFVDGNKRTALNSTWTFYAMNGYYFSYGEEIKAILKLLAVKQEMVDDGEVISYFEDITYDEESEHAPTEMIKLHHLFACYEDNFTQMISLTEEVGREFTEEEARKLGELTMDMINIASGFVQFREEYEEGLPEETIDFIDSMRESTESLLDMLQEITEAIFDSNSVEKSNEKIESILSKYSQQLEK